MGICYTFNSSKGNYVEQVNQAGMTVYLHISRLQKHVRLFCYFAFWYCLLFVGAGYGLTLVLNIEQYEYMKGPHIDAGVKASSLNRAFFPNFCTITLIISNVFVLIYSQQLLQ